MNISPTVDDVATALKTFLAAVLPATGSDGKPVSILLAMQNRVPEPSGTVFVIMTPIRFVRLATNVDGDSDVKFTASITGTAMTVSAVQTGGVEAGAAMFGVGLVPGTVVVSQTSGPAGGAGVYVVNPGQTLSSRTLSAGTKSMTQSAEVTVQLDFHSADGTAADLAQTASTALRDEYGTTFFAALQAPLNGVSPLHADDPRMMPFQNDQQQWEWRWVLEACLQVDQMVSPAQQYADAGTVVVKDVDAVFPP